MSKRLGLSLIVILLLQPARGQVRLAVFAGPQASTVKYTVRDVAQDTRYKMGFTAGLGLKVPFENRLFFFPSVQYSMKGYEVTLKTPAFPPTELAVNNDVVMHTIEISPLFQVDLGNKPSHPFFRIGAGLDYAFSGKEKFDTLDTNGNPGRVERPMNFDYTEYGRITSLATIHLGYEHQNGLMIFGFYSHGIGSRNNGDFGPRILHRTFGLSVGWTPKELK